MGEPACSHQCTAGENPSIQRTMRQGDLFICGHEEKIVLANNLPPAQ